MFSNDRSFVNIFFLSSKPQNVFLLCMLKNFWNKSHINFGPPPQKRPFLGGGPTFMILERCNDRIRSKIFLRKQKYISDAEKNFFGWKTKNDKKKYHWNFQNPKKDQNLMIFRKKYFEKKNSQNFSFFSKHKHVVFFSFSII